MPESALTIGCTAWHLLSIKMKKLDLSGQRFGILTALEDTGKRKRGSKIWLCRCDCGNYREVAAGSLRSGAAKSCGCQNKCREIEPHKTYGNIEVLEIVNNRPRTYHAKCLLCGHEFTTNAKIILDYAERGYCGNCGKNKRRQDRDTEAKTHIGETFGSLKIIDYVGVKTISKDSVYGTAIVKCKCEKCGSITEIPLTRLKNGIIKECRHCGRKNLKKGREITKDASKEGTNVFAIQNRALNKNSTTGVNGVTFRQRENKYYAYINFKRKQYSLGLYENIEDAAAARKKAEERIYGEFLEWYAETYPEQWAKIKSKA